jgi:hypothetical protein
MAAPNLRTDLALVQLPSTYPNVGGLTGKNTLVTDPDFGTQIVRVTDATSGAGNNLSMQTTDDTSAYSVWNTDDTLLCLHNTNAQGYLFQFNPATMQATQLTTGPILTGAYCFSRISPGIIYNNPVSTPNIINQLTYSLVGGVWTYQSTVQLCDFSNGGGGPLPGGYVIKWVGTLTVSEGDTIFNLSFGLGAQGTGYYCCLYQPGSGFRMLDTQTLAVTGSWGTTGTLTGIAGAAISPFLIHDSSQTPNPTYTNIAANGASYTWVWDNATLTMVSNTTSGHMVLGYASQYSGGAGGGQFQSIPPTFAIPPGSNPVKTNIIPAVAGPPGLPAKQTPPQTYTGDQHSGLGTINSSDNALLWTSNGPPAVFPFTSCWMGEIRGLDCTGLVSGTIGYVYRACHTFNSGKSPTFIVQNAFCSPSRSGNFVAFTSDWGGSGTVGPLGSTAGGATGVIGGNARGDVFIVQISRFVPPLAGGNVTGVFQYPTGLPVANGKYQWKLLSEGAIKTSAAVVPTLISGLLDGNGSMSATLYFNDELLTQLGYTSEYQLTIKAQGGAQVWNEKYFLTGTAANLNLITPTGGVT